MNMPIKQKAKLLRKDSITSIILATIFVFVYFLILIYTYNSLTNTAENEILKATSNAATSLSRIIAADSVQMDALADDINSRTENAGFFKSENQAKMSDFLAKKKPEDCIMSTFFYADSTFITSLGSNGNISDIKDFEAKISNSNIFAINVAEQVNKNFIHYYREITDNSGNLLGYVTTTYDYSGTLSRCYNTSEDVENIHDILFTIDGTIITCTGD